MSANVQFAFDAENVIDVDLEKVTDTMIAALAEANKKAKTMEEKVAALEEQVKAMEAHETARRVSDAKKAVMNRLDALNKDRDARCMYSKDLADALCAKIETGCFNEACNEKGEWCGDQMAVMELEAKCAQEQEKMDKAAAEKAKKAMSWNAFAGEAKPDPNSIDALLAYAKQ
jgi:Mg2+ and Co2+ transporter CorA